MSCQPHQLLWHFLSLVLCLLRLALSFPSSSLPLLLSFAISPSSAWSPQLSAPSQGPPLNACLSGLALCLSLHLTASRCHICFNSFCLAPALSLCLPLSLCHLLSLISSVSRPLSPSHPRPRWLLQAVLQPFPSPPSLVLPTSGNNYSGLEWNPPVPQTDPQAAHGDQMATDSSKN